ncbi:hypothetical protein M9H77_09372 [Catharanthus roseus]|uniref:Uncharacterized protein n=1 Tax=Catharanthus roseus TaxID=4058 RepID=A0ACC0C0L8_CATRO|nr:hypothetical protein M9H77_09372 [Catharanthus roseus]
MDPSPDPNPLDFMAYSLRNYTWEKNDAELSSKEKGDRTARENGQSVNLDVEWRNIVERLSILSSEEIRGLRFQSIEEAEEFYSCHSKMVGFSVKKDDLIGDEEDRITYRYWAENFQEFPRCCKNKRWTKKVKLTSKWCESNKLPKDTIETARCGVLNALSN